MNSTDAQRKRWRENRENGLCACGRPPDAGETVCPSCKASTVRTKAKYVAAGKCPCSKPLDTGLSRCAKCLKASRDWNRRYRGWTEEEIERGSRC